MSTPSLTKQQMQETVDAIQTHGDQPKAAAALGLPVSTLKHRLQRAVAAGVQPNGVSPDDPKLLKRRIQQLTVDLREAEKQSADVNTIKEALGTIRLKLDEQTAPIWTQKLRAPSSPGVPTLFLSDVHHGEIVHPSQINGVNKFNATICRRRLRYTMDTAIHLLRILDKDLDYPGIVVPLGGDMISGNIHDELVATNELNSIPAMLDLHGELVALLSLAADAFGHVFVPCVSGNHGRDTRKIWAKDRHHTSFDWLLYQFLAKTFAERGDKRVTFYVPDGPDAHYRIYNYRYVLTHGDQFRGGDGIIGPIGPLVRGDQKKRSRNSQIAQDYDTMICGHWHQYIHLRRLIVNGSVKGYDEYAFAGNFPFEEPTQALWMTHPRFGITFRMPVFCEQPTKQRVASWVSVPK